MVGTNLSHCGEIERLMINTIVQLHGAPIILLVILQATCNNMGGLQEANKCGEEIFFTMSDAPEAVNLRSFVQPEASVKAQLFAKQKCFFVIDGEQIISK
jgi:hypothetical protein